MSMLSSEILAKYYLKRYLERLRIERRNWNNIPMPDESIGTKHVNVSHRPTGKVWCGTRASNIKPILMCESYSQLRPAKRRLLLGTSLPNIASPRVNAGGDIPAPSYSRLHGIMTKTGYDTDAIERPSIGFNGKHPQQGSDLR